MNKRCSRCKEEKPLKDFYRNRASKYGRENYCRECKITYIKENKKPDQAEKRRKHYLKNKEAWVRYQRKYLRTDKGKKLAAASRRRYRNNNKYKDDARSKVAYAIRTGRLKKPETCSKCPSSTYIEAHHPDHTKPLEVIWMCRSCHSDHHRMECTFTRERT